jgi:tetratricopeptide (TPR) repeat protein
MELAKIHNQKRNYKKSLACYTAMIKKNTKGSIWQLYGYKGRAMVYENLNEQGDKDKALDDYAMIIALSSEDMPVYLRPSDAYFSRAHIFEWRNGLDNPMEYDKAIAENSAVIDKGTGNSSDILLAYWHRTDLYRKLKEYDKALEDYSAIITLDKDGSFFRKVAYKERMELYKEMGETDKALLDYNSWMSIDDSLFSPAPEYKILGEDEI